MLCFSTNLESYNFHACEDWYIIFIVMDSYAPYPVFCNYLFEAHGIFNLKLEYIPLS